MRESVAFIPYRTFRQNPHPTENERNALSKSLNLEARQIKVRGRGATPFAQQLGGRYEIGATQCDPIQ
jgi:hypothetical protein